VDKKLQTTKDFPIIYTNTFIKVDVTDPKLPEEQQVVDSFNYSATARTMSVGNTDPGASDQIATLSRHLRKIVLKVSKDRWPTEASEYSRNPDVIKSIIPLINNFRLIKSAYEIDLLKKVGDITGEAFIEVGRIKYQIRNTLD